jgi:hypothetical protein
MPERPTSGLLCPKCRTHNGRLTDPDQRERRVLIYACDHCGHLWTRHIPDERGDTEDDHPDARSR